MFKLILLATAFLHYFVQSLPIDKYELESSGLGTPHKIVPQVQSAVQQPQRPKVNIDYSNKYFGGQPGISSPNSSYEKPGVASMYNEPGMPGAGARKLKFRISLRGIEDVDLIGKTDPYVKVYYTEGTKSLETFIGQTKVKENNENPDFDKVFDFDYEPGKRQKYHFVVLDDDSSAKDDEVGEAFVQADEYARKLGDFQVNLSQNGRLILKHA